MIHPYLKTIMSTNRLRVVYEHMQTLNPLTRQDKEETLDTIWMTAVMIKIIPLYIRQRLITLRRLEQNTVILP